MVNNGRFTITLNLELDRPLVEAYTQEVLSHYNMDVSAFTEEEIAQAWLAAIQHRLELLAEDSDEFLAHNGTEERFFQALLANQPPHGEGSV
jgi:hypothetical protein